MIELKVDEYCHDCPEFVPESCKLIGRNDDKLETYTAVLCANWNLCARIKYYLDGRSGKEKNDECDKCVLSLDSPCRTCEKSENCGSFKCRLFLDWLYLKWPAIQSVLRKAGKENE